MPRCTLVDLLASEHAQVDDLPDSLKTRARLISFGLTPGVKIRVIQNHGSSSLLLEARGLRFALGRSEAKLIPVTKL